MFKTSLGPEIWVQRISWILRVKDPQLLEMSQLVILHRLDSSRKCQDTVEEYNLLTWTTQWIQCQSWESKEVVSNRHLQSTWAVAQHHLRCLKPTNQIPQKHQVDHRMPLWLIHTTRTHISVWIQLVHLYNLRILKDWLRNRLISKTKWK